MQVRDIIEAREKARGGAVGGGISNQQAGSKGQMRHVSITGAWYGSSLVSTSTQIDVLVGMRILLLTIKPP